MMVLTNQRTSPGALNDALIAGAKPENIVIRTIKLDVEAVHAPCLNCRVWIDSLNIYVVPR